MDELDVDALDEDVVGCSVLAGAVEDEVVCAGALVEVLAAVDELDVEEEEEGVDEDDALVIAAVGELVDGEDELVEEADADVFEDAAALLVLVEDKGELSDADAEALAACWDEIELATAARSLERDEATDMADDWTSDQTGLALDLVVEVTGADVVLVDVVLVVVASVDVDVDVEVVFMGRPTSPAAI